MSEFLSLSLIVRAAAGIAFLCAIWMFVRIMNATNDLEWSDLISTPGHDGKQHADWDKIGKGLGVVLCFWLPIVYVYSPKMDATGIAIVLAPVLIYLGGVSAYSATLRARRGSVTTTTEPAPDPSSSKVTKVETPPIAASGAYGEGR